MLERIRFGGFSGTYKIRKAELARDKKTQTFAVVVLFLDDTTHTFQVEKRAKGSDLLDQVFQHLELSERDYFGLQFVQQPGDVVRWLDPNKYFRKQWNSTRDNDISFQFRVKFYVTDPSRLQEEYTRYHFYLQIKRDILDGKLPCPLNTSCLLASYTVQSELGDYNSVENGSGYLKSMRLVVDQTDELEHRILELHKLHRGQLPADSEYNYLEHAKKLYMYGVDLHKAIDSTGKHIDLGVTSLGLVVLQNNIRINVFSWSKMVKISFKRKDFFLQLRREPSENYDTLLGFSMGSHKNAKALWKSCVEHHSFFRLERPNRSPRFLPLSLGSKFYYSGRTECQAVQESKQRGKISKVFTRSPSKRIIASPKSNGSTTHSTSESSSTKTPAKLYRGHHNDNKITSKDLSTVPRKAWEQQSDDEGGFIERCAKIFETIQPPKTLPLLCNGADPNKVPGEENLITVRLLADAEGRFGFNVRGGVDLKLPVLVSRVAPDTPAGRTKPRICEGDQVMKINGRDVRGLMHEQVVALIRASKEFRAGELMLTVKPNALVGCPATGKDNSGGGNEQFYQQKTKIDSFDDDDDDKAVLPKLTGDALFAQSLLLLSEGLASGSILTQFERLYRKNSELAITDARTSENLLKNRYRDISPYDCTRVVLLNAESGDYINANYINMDIPNVGNNRYIATQGPLSNTTTDFWRMVQQESSHLIVMLTTVIERGRPKCHKYFPILGDTLQMSATFSVKCLTEMADETGSFVFREMLLCDKNTGENRIIQHMQYLDMVDHGVPSDPNIFLDFTDKVRAARKTTLLQEIDQSLKQMRLLDNNHKTDDNVIINDNDNDEDKIVPTTIMAIENGINDDDNDYLTGVVVSTQVDNNNVEIVAAATMTNSTTECDDNETVLVSSEGESPEEIVLPPSTSIHQYISAANPPVIVHCSAGIGRTGVLILIDTAISLMIRKQPVYPLEIVLAMRDQRACMVQNVSQFRFVCECICAAYAKLQANESSAASDS